MGYKKILFKMSLLLSVANSEAANSTEGYYASTRYLYSQQYASEQDTSSRPGVEQFVDGENKNRTNGASLAAGYQYGNGWRTEGEYTFREKNEFTSGSTAFPTSYNHMKLNIERLMINIYRDYDLGYRISLYVSSGVGIARVKADGWQGINTRQYAESTQNNLVYSLGAGLSYSPVDRLSIDVGYRYLDIGKVESGYNNFNNARGLKDEQMKAQLTSSEVVIGARYLL